MFTAILKSLLAIISILMVFSLYEYYSGELRVMRIKRYLIRGQTGVLTSPMAILFILECLLCSIHVPPGIEAKIKFRDIWKKKKFFNLLESALVQKNNLVEKFVLFFRLKNGVCCELRQRKKCNVMWKFQQKNKKYQLNNHFFTVT
jgi:hypothetical protein